MNTTDKIISIENYKNNSPKLRYYFTPLKVSGFVDMNSLKLLNDV